MASAKLRNPQLIGSAAVEVVRPGQRRSFCDLDAEVSVLGAILLDAAAVARVADWLLPDDFYRDNNGQIYCAAVALHRAGEPIDNITVGARLESMGILEAAGGRAHLAVLQDSVPTAANVEHYARIVKEMAVRRAIVERAEALARAARDGAALTDVKAGADNLVSSITASQLSGPKVDIEDPGDPAGWPQPMAEEAYYGLAGDVVRTITPTTESDPVAILMHFLTYFGSCAGLEPHFLVEDTQHGLNEFVGIVGATSKARKGTADKRVRRLFRLVDDDWAKARIKSGLSSGEGLIWAVRDPMYKLNAKTHDPELEDPGEDDKRLLVVEGEMATGLRRIDRDGSSLSPLLRDAWDRMPLDTLVSERSRGKAKADRNHISVLGHITKAELARYMTRTEAANGLGNRFIWVCVRRSRLLPRGSKPPNLNPVVRRLHDALSFAKQLKERAIDFDQEAGYLWDEIYEPLSEAKPGLLGAIIARGEAHAIRLAEMYAVLDLSRVIRLPHLLAALAIWEYAEASARYVFGDSLGNPHQDDVLAAIRGADKGLTAGELRDHFQRNWPAERLRAATAALVETGLLVAESVKTGGRPATRYRATRTTQSRTGGYLLLAQELRSYAVNAENALSQASSSETADNDTNGVTRKAASGEEPSDLSAYIPRAYRVENAADPELGNGLPRLPRTSADVEAEAVEALDALVAADEAPPFDEDEVWGPGL